MESNPRYNSVKGREYDSTVETKKIFRFKRNHVKIENFVLMDSINHKKNPKPRLFFV
jgi:hypothetical protein